MRYKIIFISVMCLIITSNFIPFAIASKQKIDTYYYLSTSKNNSESELRNLKFINEAMNTLDQGKNASQSYLRRIEGLLSPLAQNTYKPLLSSLIDKEGYVLGKPSIPCNKGDLKCMESFISKMKNDPNARYSFSVLYGLIEVAIRMENLGLRVPHGFKELMEVVKKLFDDAIQKYSQVIKNHNPDNMIKLIRLASLELTFIKPYKSSYKLTEEYRAKYIEIEQDVDKKYAKRREEIAKITKQELAKKRKIRQQKRAEREKKDAEEAKKRADLEQQQQEKLDHYAKEKQCKGYGGDIFGLLRGITYQGIDMRNYVDFMFQAGNGCIVQNTVDKYVIYKYGHGNDMLWARFALIKKRGRFYSVGLRMSPEKELKLIGVQTFQSLLGQFELLVFEEI